jgi:hypothetical protein
MSSVDISLTLNVTKSNVEKWCSKTIRKSILSNFEASQIDVPLTTIQPSPPEPYYTQTLPSSHNPPYQLKEPTPSIVYPDPQSSIINPTQEHSYIPQQPEQSIYIHPSNKPIYPPQEQSYMQYQDQYTRDSPSIYQDQLYLNKQQSNINQQNNQSPEQVDSLQNQFINQHSNFQNSSNYGNNSINNGINSNNNGNNYDYENHNQSLIQPDENDDHQSVKKKQKTNLYLPFRDKIIVDDSFLINDPSDIPFFEKIYKISCNDNDDLQFNVMKLEKYTNPEDEGLDSRDYSEQDSDLYFCDQSDFSSSKLSVYNRHSVEHKRNDYAINGE